MVYSIALTGGIGSGKSQVANLLAEWGATILDADLVSRDLTAPGQPLLAALAAEWGGDIVRPDGSLDRGALASKVFGDPAQVARLNALTHPPILAEMRRRAEEVGRGVVVWMVPLLLESGGAPADEVWVVDCPAALRLQRVMERDGCSAEAAAARMAAQATDEQRLQAADVVVHNHGSRDELLREVRLQWEQLLLRANLTQEAAAPPEAAAHPKRLEEPPL